jgi:DNA ligase-1
VTLFAHLVGASQRVSAASARTAKVRELAGFLKALPPDEIETAVHYLSGDIPQGRIGIGYSALQTLSSSTPASAESLSIAEVDHGLCTLAGMRGSGSAVRRTGELQNLAARATAPELAFLVRLLAGELRQGALAGVMVDAIAAAAALPAVQVRRAAMYSKSLGAIARATLLEGAAGLGKFQLELFSPIAPMLAQTAADVG